MSVNYLRSFEKNAWRHRILALDWFLILLVSLIAGFGVIMLYSVGMGDPSIWSYGHIVHFGVGLFIMIPVVMIRLRFFYRWAYELFTLSLLLLLLVELFGVDSMGAKRWLNVGFLNFQPSEMVKITLILALSRFFVVNVISHRLGWRRIIISLVITMMPMLLILRQPDLGTSLVILFSGLSIIFLAGISWSKIIILSGLALSSLPFVWFFVLYDYQKQRVLTFLGVNNDLLGDAYHITQSKIALGSGGLWGQGFLLGAHSNLSFLPEKQTDFIFATIAEQFGFVGSLLLMLVYSVIIIYGLIISVRSEDTFGKLVAGGASVTFGIYLVVNIGMVSGLLPVVGIPLPLVSRGGTAMVVVMILIGLIINVQIEQKLQMRTEHD